MEPWVEDGGMDGVRDRVRDPASYTLRTSVEMIRADTEHALRFVPGLRSASITYSDGLEIELTPDEAGTMEAAREHGTDYLALTAQRIRAERGL
jgi:hypothetical protein